MKIKVFCPNVNGKLEFTKEELEKILNEAYNDGYRDGNCSRYWTYTYPSITSNASDSTGRIETAPCCDKVSIGGTGDYASIQGVYDGNISATSAVSNTINKEAVQLSFDLNK